MKRTRVSIRVLAVAISLVVISAGCTGSKGSEKGAEKPDDTSSACTARKGETTAKALLRCADRSVAFIENLYGTGTGVVVNYKDKTYIVTNHHVVDPFASADVTVGGDDELGTLPVVGVDVAADIALLGPVTDTKRVTALPLGDPKVEKGDDVFLVGFPGSADVENADLTITAGLAARTRTAKDWDQNFIQSDAVIGEGQSGGALFTDSGELAGITGLAFDEGFSLALSIQDVEGAIGRIIRDGGDETVQVPVSVDDKTAGDLRGGATEGVISFTNDLETPTLFLPPSESDRDWNVTFSSPSPRISVTALDALTGEPMFVNAAGIDLLKELMTAEYERLGIEASDDSENAVPEIPADVAAREVAPGTFKLSVPAGAVVEVAVGVPHDVVPLDVSWTSDLELWPLTEEVKTTTLELDKAVTGTVSSYRLGVPFQVNLEAGQKVTISASSPTGDVGLVITAPGRTLTSTDMNRGVNDEEIKFFDDSDKGLYGLDVLETFTATKSGLHNLMLQNNDSVPLAYRIEIKSS